MVLLLFTPKTHRQQKNTASEKHSLGLGTKPHRAFGGGDGGVCWPRSVLGLFPASSFSNSILPLSFHHSHLCLLSLCVPVVAQYQVLFIQWALDLTSIPLSFQPLLLGFKTLVPLF